MVGTTLALAEDDECNAHDGACALNALQVRGSIGLPSQVSAHPPPAELVEVDDSANATESYPLCIKNIHITGTCRCGAAIGSPGRTCCFSRDLQHTILCGRTARCRVPRRGASDFWTRVWCVAR